jgi:hypothetical protein
MSELTKQQLTVENNSSFPNNNTGFITPTLLRTFNGNIIDSMVDEITYNADSASWTSDITALEQFSSSLVTNFATVTQLNQSSSTLQSNIDTKLSTASFNTYTASQSPSATGSLLLTASAVGNVITFTKGDNSTFPVTVATGSAINTGSFVTTSSFNSYTASAASGVSASINAATSSLSASLTLTDNSKLNTGSFNTYTASASTNVSASINAATQSLSSSVAAINALQLTTASAVGDTITFTKGNGTTFPVTITVATGSLPAGLVSSSAQIAAFGYATTGSNTFRGNQIISGNLNVSGNITATSASFQYVQTVYETASIIFSSGSNQLGDELTDVQTLSGSVKVQGSLTVNGTNVLLVGQTASFASSSISASFALTASEARNVVIIARNGNPSSLPAGTVVHITGASGDNPIFNTASYDTELLSANTLGVLRTTATSGADVEVLVNGIVTGVNTDPANGFVAGDIIYLGPTGSFTRVQPQAPNQTVTIGQVLRAQQNNGSLYVNITNGWELNELHNVAINGVVDGDLLVYRSGSYGLWTNSSSLELGLINSSSFNTYTSSEAANVSASINSATASLSSSISSSIGVLSASLAATDAGQLSTSSFNAFTASVITTGSATLIQNITGSLIISGATFNAKVSESALSVGTTTLDTLFESTASGVTSQIDLTRLGAGPTGDLTGVRLQTLSGSDTTGDTLLSRVTTAVNRHTSTAMTGSVVNTSVTATWATGSAGTRVSYTSTVNANAQSASATLTLTAGNAASNYNGGTASLQAGRINIGATGATINITGSNPNILSGSLSGSLISNLGDIYTGSNNANFIITLGSASMASLLAGSATNANTLYFVI